MPAVSAAAKVLEAPSPKHANKGIASIRISAGSPEADLAAAIRPGVRVVRPARMESAGQLRLIDRLLRQLERLKGVRPGTVAIEVVFESVRGIVALREIVCSSARITTVAVDRAALAGDLGIEPDIGIEAIDYAQGECALAAIADLGAERPAVLEPATPQGVWTPAVTEWETGTPDQSGRFTLTENEEAHLR